MFCKITLIRSLKKIYKNNNNLFLIQDLLLILVRNIWNIPVKKPLQNTVNEDNDLHGVQHRIVSFITLKYSNNLHNGQRCIDLLLLPTKYTISIKCRHRNLYIFNLCKRIVSTNSCRQVTRLGQWPYALKTTYYTTFHDTNFIEYMHLYLSNRNLMVIVL